MSPKAIARSDQKLARLTHKQLARMIRPRLPPIPPGEHLKEILTDFGLTKSRFAKALHMRPDHVTAIIDNRRRITAETALRLARYFGTSAEMWMNLRSNYELDVARDRSEAAIRKEVKRRKASSA